jgi:alpha-aminoadipate/glutamate carrier protein LysW
MILCPECESSIDVDKEEMDEGEIVSCSECGTDFEVVTTEPFELVRVEDAEEDEDAKDTDADSDDGDM